MSLHPTVAPHSLPDGFVYLKDIDPSILQEVRYAGHHNFIGRPIAGYLAPVIITLESIAIALKAIQAELKPFNLTLKVYDAYRPQDAVDSFIAWAEDLADQTMKTEFTPQSIKKTYLI